MRGDLDVEGLYPTAAPTQHPSASSNAIPANIPVSKVVQHGGLRIGFTHGHTIVPNGDPDALLIAARHMDVDVLCWGGTNRFEAYEMEGKFFVNPGSATGAESWGWVEGQSGNGKDAEQAEDSGEGVPSFCLMDVSWPEPDERQSFQPDLLWYTTFANSCGRYKETSSFFMSIN